MALVRRRRSRNSRSRRLTTEAQALDRQAYSHCGAAGVGENFHEAAELPNALPHPGDSDAGQRRTSVQLLQNLLGYAAAVVSDLEDEFTGLPEEADFGSRTARVAFNIGERFLCDAKQGCFHIGGEPAQPAGKTETDLWAEPPVIASDISPEGGAQSLLFQQGWLDQIGKIAKIIAAFAHQFQTFGEVPLGGRRQFGRRLADEGELELQGGEALEGAVMQPARDATPIFILDLQQASGKRMKDFFVPFLVGKIRNNDAKAIDSVKHQAIDGQGYRYPRTAGRFQPHFALCTDPVHG